MWNIYVQEVLSFIDTNLRVIQKIKKILKENFDIWFSLSVLL